MENGETICRRLDSRRPRYEVYLESEVNFRSFWIVGIMSVLTFEKTRSSSSFLSSSLCLSKTFSVVFRSSRFCDFISSSWFRAIKSSVRALTLSSNSSCASRNAASAIFNSVISRKAVTDATTLSPSIMGLHKTDIEKVLPFLWVKRSLAEQYWFPVIITLRIGHCSSAKDEPSTL